MIKKSFAKVHPSFRRIIKNEFRPVIAPIEKSGFVLLDASDLHVRFLFSEKNCYLQFTWDYRDQILGSEFSFSKPYDSGLLREAYPVWCLVELLFPDESPKYVHHPLPLKDQIQYWMSNIPVVLDFLSNPDPFVLKTLADVKRALSEDQFSDTPFEDDYKIQDMVIKNAKQAILKAKKIAT